MIWEWQTPTLSIILLRDSNLRSDINYKDKLEKSKIKLQRGFGDAIQVVVSSRKNEQKTTECKWHNVQRKAIMRLL
jgi:hypothetical protein